RHRRIGQLHTLSLQDELTGLYNRRAFMTLGEQQLKIARREDSGVTLAFADLDGLKSINDQCGHTFGDFALKDSAKILKNTLRKCCLRATGECMPTSARVAVRSGRISSLLISQ